MMRMAEVQNFLVSPALFRFQLDTHLQGVISYLFLGIEGLSEYTSRGTQ